MIGFFELIAYIRQRPALYLGKRSLSHLVTFLDGYTFALRQQNIPVTPEEILFEEFQEWIEKRFDQKPSRHWSKIILFYSEDERKALETFFALLDEFIQENSEKMTKIQDDTSKRQQKLQPEAALTMMSEK